MRFLNRLAIPAPEFLTSSVVHRRRDELIAFVEAAQSDSRQQRRAPIDRAILGNGELKEALFGISGGTCAYCETPFQETELNVSNHRPAGLAAGADGQTEFLHYVWLAYDWDNLLPVCAICSRTKENQFPVQGARGPLLASVAELRGVEQELLLDPCFHDPSEHLRFFADGFAKPASDVGGETLRLLNLNRDGLVQKRREACDQAASRIELGRPLKVVATGVGSGWGSEILPDVAHAGAVGLALLDTALRLNLPASSLGKLLDLLSGDSAARQRFLNAFRPGLTSSADEPEALTPLPEPVHYLARGSARPPSRAFSVERQPLSRPPIRSVRIENFKALDSIEFELPVQVEDVERVPCMIILGENAAGKSSVLEALTLALLGADEVKALNHIVGEEEITPQDAAHRPDPERWDVVGPNPVRIEVRYHGHDDVTTLTGGPHDLKYGGSPSTAKVLLAYGPRRFFNTIPRRRFRAPAYRVRSLFDPLATISNPSHWLLACPEAVFDAAVRAMRPILMLGEEGDFYREDGRIFIQSESGRLPLSELSVGYKSVIALATDIMMELTAHYDNFEHASAVVVIDEIETHLHPRWKMRIVGALRQAFPQVQFILTTHDPLCLRGMYDGEVFVLRRRPDDNRIEQLVDLPDVRGMRAEQILTSEFFGLGSTDPETDAKLVRYHELVAAGIESVETTDLRSELSEHMKMGDTIQDQLLAEAMHKADLDPLAPLAKFTSRPRKEMVEELLAAIRAPLDAGREASG